MLHMSYITAQTFEEVYRQTSANTCDVGSVFVLPVHKTQRRINVFGQYREDNQTCEQALHKCNVRACARCQGESLPWPEHHTAKGTSSERSATTSWHYVFCGILGCCGQGKTRLLNTDARLCGGERSADKVRGKACWWIAPRTRACVQSSSNADST